MMYLLLAWILSPLAILRLVLNLDAGPPRKVLLIQTAKIGDYICTTPLIRALRQAFPEAKLSLLVNPLTEPLARHQPEIDRVFALPGGRIRGFSGRWALYRFLRQEGFDTTLCISPNLAFLLIPFLAGVQRRASILPNFNGRSYRLAAPFLSAAEAHQQGRMMIETAMALLRHLGVNSDLPSKEIAPAPGASERIDSTLPALSGRKWIGLGISSGNKLKEMGKDKLVELMTGLLSLAPDMGVALIGSNADSPLAKELSAAMDIPASASRILDTTGQVALEDLAALIDRLELYIGVDSGITYLADARGIPVIDIMGPADPEDQRPTGRRTIIIQSELPCTPCSHAFLAPYSCAIGSRSCVTSCDIQQILLVIRKVLFDETRHF